MTILFDLFNCQPQQGTKVKYHGGGEYIKAVFKRLVELNYSNSLIAFYNKDLDLDERILLVIKDNSIKTINVKSWKEISNIFSNYFIDVFYSGLPYIPLNNIISGNVKCIGTFHGLRAIELPTDRYEYLYFDGIKQMKSIIRKNFKQLLRLKAIYYSNKQFNTYDSIVCVSNHTRYAIKNYISEIKNEIFVFYTPPKIVSAECKNNSPLVKGKYVLLISVNRFEKNAYRAILAFEGLFDRDKFNDYKIVLVGGLPRKIKQKINHIDKYVLYDYIEAEELENLYKYCDFFMYPTLNEGFGMPPLEAMKYGKTCIVSAVCSLPEICGDAVYYVNPYDIGELQNRILMASEKKIDMDLIMYHFHMIEKRQKEDLDKLCNFILGVS